MLHFDSAKTSLLSLAISTAGVLGACLSSFIAKRLTKPVSNKAVTERQQEQLLIQRKMKLISSRASVNDSREKEINGLVIKMAYMGYEKDIKELKDSADWKAFYDRNTNIEEATTVFQALVENSSLSIPPENQSIYGLIPIEKIPLMSSLICYSFKGEEKTAVFNSIKSIRLP